MDPVLQARENRWRKKNDLARSLQKDSPGRAASLAVLTLRMPASLRNTGRFVELARIVFSVFRERVTVHGFEILYEEFRLGADGPEGYLAATAEARELKRVAVGLETGDPWGELVDIDIMDSEGNPLGRRELDLGPRICLVCEKEAAFCSAGRLHDHDIVARSVFKIAGRPRLFANDICQDIGRLAQTATLLEAAAAPKPGLVDPFSRGAHADMDYSTFLSSAAALGPWFIESARMGAEHGGELHELLPSLREAGQAAERNMFAATGGVNTHKGLVFSLGLLCAGAGRLAAAGATLSPEACASCAAAIVRGITLRDLGSVGSGSKAPEAPIGFVSAGSLGLAAPPTKGEKLYASEGLRGIRGEAEDGFPSVLLHALPKLRSGLAAGLSMNDAMIDALLLLYTVVEDTNVLGRTGREGLAFMRAAAGNALALGGMASPEGRNAIKAMDSLFIEKNISPGGCADLLALAVFLHLLSKACGGKNRNLPKA
jgi:holo-ACP synthase/triphosphoribosyl-dephospho-CoA synthase